MENQTFVININNPAAKAATVDKIVKENFSGRIFRAINVKKDGTLREYRALMGVGKHVKGGKNSTSHIPELLTVYDMGKAATLGADGISAQGAPYRSFNMSTTLMLEFVKDGVKKTYVFNDAETIQSVDKVQFSAIAIASASLVEKSISIFLGAM